MSMNYNILFGKFSNSQGKGVKTRKWNELVELLNANGPPIKDVDRWKRVG